MGTCWVIISMAYFWLICSVKNALSYAVLPRLQQVENKPLFLHHVVHAQTNQIEIFDYLCYAHFLSLKIEYSNPFKICFYFTWSWLLQQSFCPTSTNTWLLACSWLIDRTNVLACLKLFGRVLHEGCQIALSSLSYTWR